MSISKEDAAAVLDGLRDDIWARARKGMTISESEYDLMTGHAPHGWCWGSGFRGWKLRPGVIKALNAADKP